MNQILRLPNQNRLYISITCFIFILLNALPTQATIPNSIPGVYNVTNSDNCSGTCTIQNGGTLNISGNSTVVTFTGSITIMPGGKLNISNGATVKMAAGTKIAVKSSNSASVASARINVDNSHITSTAAGVFWVRHRNIKRYGKLAVPSLC